jgi:adenine phosphoribosyltransferase
VVTTVNFDLRSHIRSVPNFPKPGIMFRDITTLLKDPAAFRAAVDQLEAFYRERRIEAVVGIESRGFVLGAALAYRLGAGFVPVRKPGKLPAEAIRESYSLEYGTDAVEIHRDALQPGQRVLLHDDLLATGGTMSAACSLVRRLGAEIIGLSFLVELDFLRGRARLPDHEIFSLVHYDAE